MITMWRLELLGGPFDGVRGFEWREEEDKTPLPEVLFVGTCSGDGACGDARCRVWGSRHPAFWTDVDAERRPTGCVEYPLKQKVVEVPSWLRRAGVAVYAIGDAWDRSEQLVSEVREPVAA